MAKNRDCVLTIEDVKAWEAKNGQITEAAFVAMRTDWSKRWPRYGKKPNKEANELEH